MDDLPVWGFVGPPPEETRDEERIYIWTHKSFDINYNENRVCARAAPARTAAPGLLLLHAWGTHAACVSALSRCGPDGVLQDRNPLPGQRLGERAHCH
jgi:hypothetical protein